MLRSLFSIVFILVFTNLTFAQVRATTESGNKVLLFDNGTWQYEEKSVDGEENVAVTASAIGVAAIAVDSTREIATEPKDLFYLPSPRLVKYFGEQGGHIRCKVSCSNNLGDVKLQFAWEFPVSDGSRYFGWFKEGSIVTLTMDNEEKVELVMGDENKVKSYEKNNYSMISNISKPLTNKQIAELCAQPIRKVEVGWKKKVEEYDVGISRFVMDTLPTVL